MISTRMQNLHLAPENEDDDLYSGFDDYNASLMNDVNPYDSLEFSNAAAAEQRVRKTASTTSKPYFGVRLGTAAGQRRQGTASGNRLGTSAMKKTAAGFRPPTSSGGVRPMTAIRAAGYDSQQVRSSTFDALRSAQIPDEPKVEEDYEEKYKAMEKKVYDLLHESVFANEKGDYKLALEKAKEAGRKERAAVKLRVQHNLPDQSNLDLTFFVLFNLANQYSANEMYNEALDTYGVILKNKVFTNTGKLRVNIGNIHFVRKEYEEALKSYRKALDQVPHLQKETRIKIMNNIGLVFVKMNKYDEALSSFEHCMEEKPDFKPAMNMLICANILDDREKMKEAFQRMLDVHLDIEDEDKYVLHSNDPREILVLEAIKNDNLRQWEKVKKQEAERCILTAAKLIAPHVASNFSDGFAWCIDCIKQSSFAELATDLEINKAVQFLKQRDISAASEVLKSFENKESKVASIAANNLTFLNILKEDLKEAESYADKALNFDRYNPYALVNKGDVYFASGDYEKARSFYREALANEASCVEALYNLGLANKRLSKFDEALDCFLKLHQILRNNTQVLYQIGNIYDILEDSAQAIEWYTQAHSMLPSDPSILAKLGEVYDKEGDKSQAFQCYYDSYRLYPSNIDVIEWLGAYYIDAQFSEKAVNYFEKAALIQPDQFKWPLMIASCYRRSGNYQKAYEMYKQVHRKFPDNVECLKFLVRLSNDMELPERQEYATKLKKAEKFRELKEQQRNSPSDQKASAHSRPASSRGSLRTGTGSGKRGNSKKQDDFHHPDPLGPTTPNNGGRLKTGVNRGKSLKIEADDDFANEELGDDLLPE